MTLFLTLNESSASSRVVPMWCVQSNGTSAATNESGATFNFSVGGVYYGSGGSLSAVSANMGLYTANFSASKISVVGQGFVMYSSGTALPTMTPFMVVPFQSFDSMRLGLFALPNSAPNISGGLPQLGTDYGSLLTVGVSNIKAATYSGTTIGVSNIAPGVYSGVSVGIRDSGIATTTFIAGNYSGVSVEVKTGGIQVVSIGTGSVFSGVSFEVKPGGIQTTSIGKGAYSGVSLEITTGGIQTVSVGKGAYSGVSVEITTGGIQTVSVGKGAYSGVSLEVTTGGIQVASVGVGAYSGVTIDGAKFLSPAGERSAASSLLSTNLGGTTPHLVQQAIELLRNRVQVSGSTMTVYQTDGATSSWTAAVSTGTATVYQITPNT